VCSLQRSWGSVGRRRRLLTSQQFGGAPQPRGHFTWYQIPWLVPACFLMDIGSAQWD
jgi:hypothetical protein